MNQTGQTAIIYYTASVLLSIILSAALIFHLNWPSTAEIPLCLSIFIQLTAIAKALQNFIQDTDSESLMEAYTMLKEGALDQKSAN